MASSVEQLKAQLRGLPSEERFELARFLLESLEPEDDGTVAAWEEEVARRVAEIRRGQAVGKPAEQVFAELLAQYP